jgi:hypothetical protein
MKLQIERQYVEAMVEEFPGLAPLKDQLRFGNKAEVAFTQLANAEVAFLRNLYEEGGPEMRARAAHLATLQQALNDDGTRFQADELEMLVPAIARYLAADAIRG